MSLKIDKSGFVDGWFVRTMPDLNQRNRLMANYLTQNSIWWVEYAGLAGIRMDTYPYPDMDYMSEWTARLMEEYPDFNIVGEEWHGNPAIVSYWQKGKVNSNGYTSELKSLMDFPLQEALVKALNGEEGWGTGWIELYQMLANDFLYADPDNLVVFPDNHDMSRFYTWVNEDFELFKMGICLYFDHSWHSADLLWYRSAHEKPWYYGSWYYSNRFSRRLERRQGQCFYRSWFNC